MVLIKLESIKKLHPVIISFSIKYMKLAIINSNVIKIGKNTKKGTEIFVYFLIKNLVKDKKNIHMTIFASGNSKLPAKIESVNFHSSTEDKNIGEKNHKLFELALLSKAFSMQKKFDIYHVNMMCGEYVLPFAAFVKKPIVITLHGPLNTPFQRKYFSIFNRLSNVHFVSISNAQRKPCPNLNYIKTIYHGVDTKHSFTFNPIGGKEIMWSGRAIPEKGLEHILTVVKKIKKKAKLFPIIKEEYFDWLQREIIRKRNIINEVVRIAISFDVSRKELNQNYQTSKVFLNPVEVEEGFGFTMVESMACGTPVVAYARGSIPEIVKDGETGFIVNSSEKDIRGNWIIKKTGIEGLCEAVERIYAMPEDKYRAMRLACRTHVEKNFTVERMVDQYEEVYKKILNR